MAKKVTIYAARDEMQAEFLVQVLATHEIPAEVVGAALATLVGYLPATYGRPKVLVDEADVERARPVVEQFELSRRTPAPRRGSTSAWACANCGEIIEPQFTDCWNCQAARPARAEGDAGGGDDGDAPALPERPPADPHIGADLPCVRCGYNLRNLPVERVCPECAHPAFASLLQTMQSQQDWSLENEQQLGPCLDYVEQQAGFPMEAIAFVTQVWPRALARAAGASGIGIADAAPRDDDIAEALRDLAVDFFGDPLTATRAMQRWNIATGQDVRRLRHSLGAFNFY